MPSSNPVDYGADPCGLRNSAWAINECLFAALRCDFPVGTFLLGSSPGAKIIDRVRTAGVATFNTSTPHGLVVGEKITLYGFTDASFNGTGPLQFGFAVLSIPTPTQFTAAVPGADAPLVTEDGWINLIGGGYTSSLVMGYPPFTGVINNVEFTGQGIGKTILKFADHTSTKRGDTYGANIQMLKTLGNYPGFGVVGAPGAYAGAPLDSINCKNTIIDGITFDGNYANNSVADTKITSVQRTNGVNTYNTAYPHFIETKATPAYMPPVVPAPYTNVSVLGQYISNIITVGPGNDSSFVGFGQVENITSMSFQRDLRAVIIGALRVNYITFSYITLTKHPAWNFGFTVGDSIIVTGITDATFNGTFTVAGFVSANEVYFLDTAPNPTITLPAQNGRVYSPTQYPDVLLTAQSTAGVNSSYTVAGINHVGENALIQNNQFYDFGVGIADAETFIVKSFLPMNVSDNTQGARVLNNDFSYQGRNSIQSTLYPGSAESNTQCVVGGFSSLINPINVVSRVGGVATYTCVMKHTLRVGDVVLVTMTAVQFAQRNAGIATYTTYGRHFANVGATVKIQGIVTDASFNGTWTVASIIDDLNFTVVQALPNVFPAVVANVTLYVNSTVVSIPDAFKFTVAAPGPDILPGLYLDGQVTMLRSQRIFATGCEFKYNRVQGGPDPVNQQSPVTAITVREANGADISYNNFDGFRGTCFYVDSYQHKGTHIHHNSALNISAFIALVVQDWFTLISGVPTITNPEAYSTLISGHKDMLIENNDVLLTGPGSWFYQTAYTPLDAVFLVNNHDVNKSTWYYPTDYQIPINPPLAVPAGASRDGSGISTFTTTSAHELQVGMEISTIGVSDGTFNGVFTVLSVPASNQFTVSNPGVVTTSSGGFLGINSPINFPWEIKPIGFQRTAGVATYTTNKAHQILLGYHVTVEGLSNASFNDQVIVTGTPTTTTFTCASPGPDVAFTSSIGNFFRYVDNIQIGCNSVRRLSGQGLVRNNGGQFGNAFLTGRPNRCVAPLEQFFYFDCPEGCLALECDPGPCKPNDYLYRI
jgi:hypothetical protein